MSRLSGIETIALLFAGLAGMASAVQAYVSWETRGEVSRAIVFSQRLDGCSKALAAIEPFVVKARPEGRQVVARGKPDGRYSLPQYYYGLSSGNAAFDARHRPRVEAWRTAAATFRIVSPNHAEEVVSSLDRAITRDIEEGRFFSQSDMLAWLERLDAAASDLLRDCRNLG